MTQRMTEDNREFCRTMLEHAIKGAGLLVPPTIKAKGHLQVKNSIKFTVPIIPTAQARARVAVRGKFAQAYKTADQKANERTLEAYLCQHAPPQPLTGPLVLEFVAALPLSRSDSKKTAEAKLRGEIAPTKKPDLDNLAKQLKDAMTRLQFWGDDAQVVSLRCDKIYAQTGYWAVRVYEAAPRPVAE